ncbi:hypothetical protein AB0F07_15370 [Streptomyces fructofermentans]|uniref:hypothetical protein n=1 Tax=Streptomyces fructofermentans TaxID=152141 RepID=UPI0033E61C71
MNTNGSSTRQVRLGPPRPDSDIRHVGFDTRHVGFGIRRAAIRRTVPALVLAAAAVAGTVWAPQSGTADAATTEVVASPLLLAGAAPVTEPGPLPGRVPPKLRADLRELRTLEGDERRRVAARVWKDALAGNYGTRVRIRAEQARRRVESLPPELRDDLKAVRGLRGQELRDALRPIRDKASKGGYGEAVQRWVERRDRVRPQR